jgi:hypothetical protein
LTFKDVVFGMFKAVFKFFTLVKPSTILLNIIIPIDITIVIKKFLGFLNRIKQHPIALDCNAILFSGDFYRCVSMILVTVLIIRV